MASMCLGSGSPYQRVMKRAVTVEAFIDDSLRDRRLVDAPMRIARHRFAITDAQASCWRAVASSTSSSGACPRWAPASPAWTSTSPE